MISSLVASGVAKYSGFRLLDCLTVYDKSGALKSVPGSKEDIFRSKEISLLDKRRLMRFLTFASSDFEGKQELEGKQDLPFPQFLTTVFSLKEETSNVIAYSLAFCLTPEGRNVTNNPYSCLTLCTSNRRHSSCSYSTAALFKVQWTLWAVAISHRSLRRYWRHRPRVLPCFSGQRWCIYPRTRNHWHSVSFFRP